MQARYLFLALPFAMGMVSLASNVMAEIVSLDEKDRYSIETLDEHSFSSKIAEGFVLINFFASWCSSCQAFEPIFAEVAQAMQERVTFYKLDVDQAFEKAYDYGVNAIPTLLLFRDGLEIARYEDSLSKDSLVEFIQLQVEN